MTHLKVDVVLDLLDEVYHAAGDHVTLVENGAQLWDKLQLSSAAHLVLPYLCQHVLHALGSPHEVEDPQVHDLTLWGEHLSRKQNL